MIALVDASLAIRQSIEAVFAQHGYRIVKIAKTCPDDRTVAVQLTPVELASLMSELGCNGAQAIAIDDEGTEAS